MTAIPEPDWADLVGREIVADDEWAHIDTSDNITTRHIGTIKGASGDPVVLDLQLSSLRHIELRPAGEWTITDRLTREELYHPLSPPRIVPDDFLEACQRLHPDGVPDFLLRREHPRFPGGITVRTLWADWADELVRVAELVAWEAVQDHGQPDLGARYESAAAHVIAVWARS